MIATTQVETLTADQYNVLHTVWVEYNPLGLK